MPLVTAEIRGLTLEEAREKTVAMEVQAFQFLVSIAYLAPNLSGFLDRQSLVDWILTTDREIRKVYDQVVLETEGEKHE